MEELRECPFCGGKAQQSWISVEERLPDTKTVLGCNIDGYVTAVVYMCYAKKWAIAHNMRVTMDVTHWMPLPEPPKGSE